MKIKAQTKWLRFYDWGLFQCKIYRIIDLQNNKTNIYWVCKSCNKLKSLQQHWRYGMIVSFHIQGTYLVKILVHSVARNKQNEKVINLQLNKFILRKQNKKTDSMYFLNFHKITSDFYFLFISVLFRHQRPYHRKLMQTLYCLMYFIK